MTLGNDIVVQEHPDQHYRTLFNRRTGFFARKEEAGYPEPDWSADGPELIDLSITSYCTRKCTFCYRGSNDTNYQHMGMDYIQSVVEQSAACGTLQIALGGGNPNEHPNFAEILELIRKHGIVPSYTTNGNGLTEDILKATADYCGAMAVSIYAPYDWEFYDNLLHRIKSYGIRVNVHAILNRDTVGMWTRLIEKPNKLFEYVNAIIFLNYKPIGKEGERLLITDKEAIEGFFHVANQCKTVKIGFDSCSISGIAKWMNVNPILVESCEAARFSAFIREDLKVFPCSFLSGESGCGDLRKDTLLDIWKKNKLFTSFRSKETASRCRQCAFGPVCRGGCKYIDEVNFCA